MYSATKVHWTHSFWRIDIKFINSTSPMESVRIVAAYSEKWKQQSSHIHRHRSDNFELCFVETKRQSVCKYSGKQDEKRHNHCIKKNTQEFYVSVNIYWCVYAVCVCVCASERASERVFVLLPFEIILKEHHDGVKRALIHFIAVLNRIYWKEKTVLLLSM